VLPILRVAAAAVMITGFVLIMMLTIEYVNVLTGGGVRQRLRARGGRLPAVLIGTLPGCFGGFLNVTLYVHGAISLGALTGSMVAASGDEAFVMLALFPGRAVLLFLLLAGYGLFVAWLVDRLLGVRHFGRAPCESGLVVHEGEGIAPGSAFLSWRNARWSPSRMLLLGGVATFGLAVGLGWLASDEPVWLRGGVALLSAVLATLVMAAPEHFVRDHLARHVVREHGPRIFLWTVAALAVMEWATGGDPRIGTWLQAHPGLALVAAAVVGLIPESGPHLVFATFYAAGVVPFSVLAASSVVQDGHGMLPLLAESRLEFVRVKAINLAAGLAFGAVLMLLGL
jgi:hypothetical protein